MNALYVCEHDRDRDSAASADVKWNKEAEPDIDDSASSSAASASSFTASDAKASGSDAPGSDASGSDFFLP